MENEYVYRVQWPPLTVLEETASGEKENIGYKCAGIIYTITKAPDANQTSFQQLACHLWSTVIQTPFYKCPLALVVQDKQDILIPMLPNIIRMHHFVEHLQDYIQIFESATEAESWIKKKHNTQHTPPTQALHY